MIAKYNRLSLAFGVPGLLMQIGGRVMMVTSPDELQLIAAAIVVVGTALLMAGLALYAMAKGRNPAWCLMAFLSLIGLIVLGLLKDKAPNG